MNKIRITTLSILAIIWLSILLLPSPNFRHADPNHPFTPVSNTHWLGTDYLGRDVWALVSQGALRTTIVVLVAATVSFGGGLILGIISGYFRGLTAAIIQSITDLSMIIPSFIMALIVAAAIGLTPWTAGLTLGILEVGPYVNQSCFLTQQIRNSEFIQAELILGSSSSRILLCHLLPNILRPTLASFGSKASSFVLSYAGLAFIGLGTDITIPDWGTLLYQYRIYLMSHPVLVIAPMCGIFLFALFFHLLSDTSSRRQRRHG